MLSLLATHTSMDWIGGGQWNGRTEMNRGEQRRTVEWTEERRIRRRHWKIIRINSIWETSFSLSLIEWLCLFDIAWQTNKNSSIEATKWTPYSHKCICEQHQVKWSRQQTSARLKVAHPRHTCWSCFSHAKMSRFGHSAIRPFGGNPEKRIMIGGAVCLCWLINAFETWSLERDVATILSGFLVERVSFCCWHRTWMLDELLFVVAQVANHTHTNTHTNARFSPWLIDNGTQAI